MSGPNSFDKFNEIFSEFWKSAERLDQFFKKMAEINRKFAFEDDTGKCADCGTQLIDGFYCHNCDLGRKKNKYVW